MIRLNKYTRLAKDTMIFAIGTFSSKILVFVMMPVVTRALSTGNYGIVDLIVQTSNLLLPLVTIGITNSIIRFGLDKSYRKSDVFTTGVLAVIVGFLLLLCFSPLLRMIQSVGNYLLLLLIYVLMSSFRSLCSNYVRSKSYVKLYAVDGFLNTLMNCSLTLLFLLGFHWDITGYLLAIILPDFLSICFLVFSGDLLKDIRLRGLNLGTSFEMIRYAVPMIPTNVFWWVVATSDRYIIAFMLGEAANGLYAASQKVPTILMLVSTIFMDAWQVSAVKEHKQKDRAQFFSKIFNAFQGIMFLVSALLIPFSKVLTTILVGPDFYSSWQYIPFLVLAIAFCCLVNFTGSIYMVEKKSVATLVTTILGAVSNVVLNFILIPIFGAQGAAIATFISYFLVFVVRLIHTRRWIHIRINTLAFILNTVLLIVQATLLCMEVHLWILYEVLIVLLIIWLNLSAIAQSVQKIISRKKRRA